MRFRLLPQLVLEPTQPLCRTPTIRQLPVPVTEPDFMSLDLNMICSGSLLITEFNGTASDIINMSVEAALWDAKLSGELADAPGLEELFEVLRIVVFGFGHLIIFVPLHKLKIHYPNNLIIVPASVDAYPYLLVFF